MMRERKSHIWERQAEEWYAEPSWVSRRLFDEEKFDGEIWDPCCGLGTILLNVCGPRWGSDIVSRGNLCDEVADFRTIDRGVKPQNIVCNPPFNIAAEFALRALALDADKVAMIFPTARLNAAHWLHGTPLRRVWLMTPRPSMPPGDVVAAGGKVGGGKVDFCWIIFEHGYAGKPELRWLRRDQ